MISMVVFAPHGEFAKALPVVRLATHKHLVLFDAMAGLELLATTNLRVQYYQEMCPRPQH